MSEDWEIIHERVAGLDVGKGEVVACVRTPVRAGGRRFRQETRTFSTMTAGLLQLRDWLVGRGVELVAMEATGDYWKPVYYLLEDGLDEVWLVNAQHVKNVKGRKTDVNDAQWIAKLAAYGLVRPSFVPPPPIRRLRDLTRQRTNAIRERTRVHNRVESILEDAGVKTSLVLSKTLGKSNRRMLEALIDGERDVEVLADLALGRARAKIDDLRQALVGRFNDHHGFLARQALTHIDFLDAQIEAFTGRIEEELRPFARQRQLLCTIPGVSDRTASLLIAEIGVDMSRFPTPQALASWAGVAPGNDRSAGKNKNAATTPGNHWLQGALGDAAAAAIRVKASYLRVFYRKLAKRRGPKRAHVAVMHKILTGIWHMLTHNVEWNDLGHDYHHRRPDVLERRKQHHLNQLAALGVDTSPLRQTTQAA